MEEEAVRKAPSAHEVGMMLDTMSEEELQARIGLLEGEIARLRAAIEARRQTRETAKNFFKF